MFARFKNQSKLHPSMWMLIKLAITLTGFVLLRRSGALSSEAVFKMVESPTAAAMFAVACSYDLLRGFSLYWVLRRTGRPTPLWLCVKAQLIGHFFNFFLPGQAGGFGAKTIYLSRLLEIPWRSAINILTVELLMGFLALTTFTAVNVSWLAMRSEDPALSARSWMYAVAALAFTLGIPLLLRAARRSDWIPAPSPSGTGWKDEFYTAAVWLDRWPLCLQIGGLAFVTYFMKCVVLLIAARQLGAPAAVDYAAICSSFSLGVMVSLVPIAPGGLITGNFGFGAALTLLTGASFALGADIYTAIWLVHAALGACGGLIFFFERFHGRMKAGPGT